ncbi:hypothetical protein ANRL4_03793 [Anaerolineae bacterium]|nr:hypothetical protein ANRL4_03793 [Anaerolineae bacterium]
MTVHLLLNRPAPYLDETLVSWLWRLARQNYADSPAWFLPYLHHAGSTVMSIGLNAMNRLQDETALTRLAELTGYSVNEIHRHTLHHFAHALTPPNKPQARFGASETTLPFLPARPSNDFYLPHFSWCPHCLAEALYVRLHWHLPIVACCEMHGCWLLDRCPQCRAPITEVDIGSGHCGKCAFRLQEATPSAIPATDRLLQLQTTVMQWLYQTPERADLGLPDKAVNVLLHVLLGLRYAAQCAGQSWNFHHIPAGIPVPDLDIRERRSLTIFERGCLNATAFRGLQNWPHGFFAYLDAYRYRPSVNRETGLRHELGVLHMSWIGRLWKHTAFNFVQETYNDYLATRMPAHLVIDSNRTARYPALLQRLAYLDIHKSALYVGVCSATILRLVREGHLTVYHFENSEGRWLSRQELDQLQQRWAQHITLPEAARLLGVSVEVTRALLQERLIQAVPASEGVKLRVVYVSRDSLTAFIQKLKKHTTIQANSQPDGVSLTEVCLRNASMGLGFPQLLNRIGNGQLPAFHPNETLFPLTDLWFLGATVRNLSRSVKDERAWLNLKETEQCLGLKRRTLYRFMQMGLLQSVMAFGPKQFFAQADILALRDRYASSRQAAALLNISTADLFRLVRCGLLVPASGTSPGPKVFDRHQLVDWHAEHILPPELNSIAANKDALRCALKASDVHPLVTKPEVYLRKEVIAVLKSALTGTDQI